MTGLELLESKRAEIEDLCRRYGVRRLRVFGSATGPAWNPLLSDLDLVAEFGPPPPNVDAFQQQFGLLVQLERLTGYRIDLLDWGAVKKPLLRQEVEERALEWYAA